VTEGLPVLVCGRCGRIVFPDRLVCLDCASSEWRRAYVEGGVVEEVTTVRRAPGRLPGPVRLGTVRLDGGPPVVARLLEGTDEGDRVLLSADDGVPVARRAR
jgi:uncharacterized OB-fold protein